MGFLNVFFNGFFNQFLLFKFTLNFFNNNGFFHSSNSLQTDGAFTASDSTPTDDLLARLIAQVRDRFVIGTTNDEVRPPIVCCVVCVQFFVFYRLIGFVLVLVLVLVVCSGFFCFD